MPKAIIVGAGIAGIATSIRLSSKGYNVVVYEANAYTGGKLHAFEKMGYRFDAGPSLFTMPQYVEELFALMGEETSAHFEYLKKDVVCNYFWEDGQQFSAKADKQEFIKDASQAFDENPKAISKYLDRNAEKYAITNHVFLEKSLHKLSTYLSWATFKSFLQMPKLHINKSLHRLNKSTFKSKKLVQLFDRYATYNGSDPYKTPGIMSIIPHLEMHFGTYFPKKGMHAISQSLTQLAQRHGVEFKLNSPVSKILVEKGQARGVVVNDQTQLADVVVSNMDVFSSYRHLLKDQKQPERTLKQERSSSALIFYWGIKKEFPELDLHNIFFSENYREEFRQIFDEKGLHNDPTVYIHISSKDKKDDAPEGCENWFVMINTPGNFGQDWEALKKQARKSIIEKLNRILKTDVEALIETEDILEPITIESKTSSHRGSLYGASSNSQFAAFLRHKNFSSDIKDLYFCGGSVHPGGGIPLCLLSAKIVGEMVDGVG
ncbi:MAG: 1-hydroxycarotenoid 3,4-desaturase CrtD [Bacteroidia bacterium]